MREKPPTKTAQYMARLAKLPVGQPYRLPRKDSTYENLQLWRLAARKRGHRVSIKSDPSGVYLWPLP